MERILTPMPTTIAIVILLVLALIMVVAAAEWVCSRLDDEDDLP